MPKEPWVAVILSFIFPGVGHAYAGKVKRGLAFFSVGVGAQILLAAYTFHPSTRIGLPFFLAGVLVSIAFALYLWIDAYRSAKAWNIQHSAPSRPRWKRALLILAALLLFLVLNPTERGVRYLTENIFQAFEMGQYSMRPTLVPGDRVLIDKRIYERSEPRRGDIVVFRYPLNPTRIYIKRIVGLPGDSVEIRSGHLNIGGREVIEPYVKGAPSGDYGPQTVPAEAYFVLGDNRNNSEDSRAFGFVPRRLLLGRATKIYYPFDRSGPVQ
jgi:signal peptidase I